ncbi:rRNA pseudouridine synthase [bacterium]|nr:rRNA pseudouridine synthase [bacterium]
MSGLRIQKFLSSWGVASRRRIEEWIAGGRVLLNSSRANPGATIKEGDELVVLDACGKPSYRATLRGVYDERNCKWLNKECEYWMVNKPRGVLSSTKDPHHKMMVTALVASPARLYPVGRLDKESEGLLLLTSDGSLAHKLTHPRFGVSKKYHVTVDWPPTKETLAIIGKGGLKLEDGPAPPVSIKELSARRFELVLREGRKREIRRIFEALGHKVISLVRVAFGPLELGGLPTGKARKLTLEEIETLKRSCTGNHHSLEKRVRDKERRRPEGKTPGQIWGRESSKSSARRTTRKGSRS